MEGDPYTILAGLFDMSNKNDGSGAGLTLRRGTVLTVTPLKIDVKGRAGSITASGSELMINELMLEHTENLVPTGETPAEFEARVTPKLTAGDTVLLLTEDDQVFYVLCKVVTI